MKDDEYENSLGDQIEYAQDSGDDVLEAVLLEALSRMSPQPEVGDDLSQRAMALTADGEPDYPSVWINKAHVLIAELVSALVLSRQGRDGSCDPYIITERHSAGANTHSVTVEGLLLGEFYCREHLDLFVAAHREARKVTPR